MPDISMCAGPDPLQTLCIDCGRRTPTPSERQAYIAPAIRRAGNFSRCLNRLSPPPAFGQVHAPALANAGAGVFSE